jgi:cytosolic carboxypeptidase protein 2/3
MFEPLYVPEDEILEQSLRREIEKFCFSDQQLNRLVYDSVDPSPFHDNKTFEGITDMVPFYIP